MTTEETARVAVATIQPGPGSSSYVQPERPPVRAAPVKKKAKAAPCEARIYYAGTKKIQTVNFTTSTDATPGQVVALLLKNHPKQLLDQVRTVVVRSPKSDDIWWIRDEPNGILRINQLFNEEEMGDGQVSATSWTEADPTTTTSADGSAEPGPMRKGDINVQEFLHDTSGPIDPSIASLAQ